MPYALPDEAVEQVEEQFVSSLRRELTAQQFFAETPVQDLGIRRMNWRELTDLDSIRVSMEIPELQQTDGGVMEEYSVDIPVFTRDLHFDGRDWISYQRDGWLDTVVAEQNARIMAYMINDYLYLGGAAATEADVPGPAEGILNHTNRQTMDNSGTTNWEVPDDVVDDLSEAVRLLMDNPAHDVGAASNDGGFQPPFTLLMSPSDADLMNRLRANTDSTTGELLPDTIQGPVYDRVVDSNEAFLMKPSPDNWDVVTPVGLGNVQTFVDAPDNQELLMGQGWWQRMLWSGAPRVKRPEAVVDITFDRS